MTIMMTIMMTGMTTDGEYDYQCTTLTSKLRRTPSVRRPLDVCRTETETYCATLNNSVQLPELGEALQERTVVDGEFSGMPLRS